MGTGWGRGGQTFAYIGRIGQITFTMNSNGTPTLAAGASAQVTTLPAGYRPYTNITLPLIVVNGTPSDPGVASNCDMVIQTNGACLVRNNTNSAISWSQAGGSVGFTWSGTYIRVP